MMHVELTIQIAKSNSKLIILGANANKVHSESFKFQLKFEDNTNAANTKDVEIAEHLKYLGNFFRTFGMLLNNDDINLI